MFWKTWPFWEKVAVVSGAINGVALIATIAYAMKKSAPPSGP